MQSRKLALPVTFAALIGFAALPAQAAEQVAPESSSLGAAVVDATITAKVKARFLNDARLKNAQITVTTADNVVRLTGYAPDSATSQAAEELAATIEGVNSVDNQLATPSLASQLGEKASQIGDKTEAAARKTGQAASESWITTKVKSALLADSLTKGLDISVTTEGSKVVLAGQVHDLASAKRAHDIAKGIKGVAEVDTSGLKVAGKAS